MQRDFEQFLHLFDGEKDGEFFLGFWEFDIGHRAFGETATKDKEFIERAQGREACADG